MLKHRSRRWRTESLADADVVLILSFPTVSMHAGACNGTTHEGRQREVFAWARRLPRRLPVAFECASFTCRFVLAHVAIAPRVTLLINERNARWANLNRTEAQGLWSLDRAVVVPYTAHHELKKYRHPSRTKRGMLFIGDLHRHGPKRDIREHLRTVGAVAGRRGKLTVRQTNIDHLSGHGPATQVRDYADLMSRACFCLCPAGDSPTSRRLFDAIVAGCLPVVISDDIDKSLPFASAIPYASFWFRVRESEFRGRARAVFKRILDTPAAEVSRRQRAMARYANALNWADASNDEGFRLLVQELKRGRRRGRPG